MVWRRLRNMQIIKYLNLILPEWPSGPGREVYLQWRAMAIKHAGKLKQNFYTTVPPWPCRCSRPPLISKTSPQGYLCSYRIFRALYALLWNLRRMSKWTAGNRCLCRAWPYRVLRWFHSCFARIVGAAFQNSGTACFRVTSRASVGG